MERRLPCAVSNYELHPSSSLQMRPFQTQVRDACPALPRPPHLAPYVRDDRDTPLQGDGTLADPEVIWVSSEANFFAKGFR
jgi:hypothetical protein